ncbi:MAG: hypothetical protein RLZZ31_1954 [Actinomycetota bacterium]|jgi:putative redox protein
MEKLFRSGDLELAGHLARPRIAPGTFVPGLVISHGFPNLIEGGRLSAMSFPELAERIATEMGWMVLVFNFRGAGNSDGNFSMSGWRDDLLAAVQYLRSVEEVRGVWVAGFGTGGSLGACAAALDPEIRGVACLGSPADFDDLASQPRRLLQHAREAEIVQSSSFPSDLDEWAKGIGEVRAVTALRAVAPRPVLLVHGSDDDLVPVADARVLADAHQGADLRIIEGGGHKLRHDPRAIAILLGWLDRQRAATVAERAS